MKRNLLIFIILVILLVLAKMAYKKHCESKPEGCPQETIDYEKDGLPIEGAYW